MAKSFAFYHENLGPFGTKLTKDIFPVVTNYGGAPPIYLGRNSFSGQIETCFINPEYSQKRHMPALLERMGVRYDQASYSPFYNSVLYAQPESYHVMQRAQEVEAYAQYIHYFSETVCVHEDISQPEITGQIMAHRDALNTYSNILSENLPNPFAQLMLSVSANPALANHATSRAVFELENVAKTLQWQGQKAVRNWMDYPDLLFAFDMTMDDITSLQERRRGISVSLLNTEDQDQFWMNLNMHHDAELKWRYTEISDHLQQFRL